MQNKKAYEHGHHGHTGTPGIPYAMVLTVSFVISSVIGLVCHRRLAFTATLDASVEASGPHDFAVRLGAVRQQHHGVHRIPPHVRDDRETPLRGAGRSSILLFLPPRQVQFRKFRILLVLASCFP
jgi:hypothetical protein